MDIKKLKFSVTIHQTGLLQEINRTATKRRLVEGKQQRNTESKQKQRLTIRFTDLRPLGTN